MNTTKHTPGPWQFDGMWSLIMAGKYEIAAVHAARTHDEARKRKRIDETVANAQLISAAPDLLEACKAVLHCNDYAEGKISAEFNDVLDKVSKAIAKADPEACYKLKKAGVQ